MCDFEQQILVSIKIPSWHVPHSHPTFHQHRLSLWTFTMSYKTKFLFQSKPAFTLFHFFVWNNSKAPERRLTNRSCYKCNNISGSIFELAAFKHRTPTINRFTNIHDFSFFHWFLSVLLRMARFSRYAVKMSFI